MYLTLVLYEDKVLETCTDGEDHASPQQVLYGTRSWNALSHCLKTEESWWSAENGFVYHMLHTLCWDIEGEAQQTNQPAQKQTADSDSHKEEIRFMEVLPVMLLYVTYDIINITWLMTLHHTIYDIRLWCIHYSCYWSTSSLSLHSCARSHVFALVCIMCVGILHAGLMYTISWMTGWWLYTTQYMIFACDVYTVHVIGARRCFPFTHAHVLTCLSECVSGLHIYFIYTSYMPDDSTILSLFSLGPLLIKVPAKQPSIFGYSQSSSHKQEWNTAPTNWQYSVSVWIHFIYTSFSVFWSRGGWC